MRAPRLVLTGCLLAGLMAGGPYARAAVPTVSVRPISGPVTLAPGCADPQAENTPQIAVDPKDPRHLAASYAIGDGSASVLALSHDGGVTWSRQPLAGTVRCDGGSGAYTDRFDPDLAFAADGTLRMTESVQEPQGDGTAGIDTFALAVPAGTDTLSPPVPLVTADPLTGAQRGFLAPGPGPGQLDALTERIVYPGRYELAGDRLELAHSEDGGASFTTNEIYGAPPQQSVIGEGLLRVPGALLAFGELVDVPSNVGALLGTAPLTEQAAVLRSTDGGASFGAPQTVFAHEVGADGLTDCCLLKPVASPDGTVWWPESQGGHLVLHRSVDGGRSFTTLPVADETAVSEPTLAAGSGGRLAVAYYALTGDGRATARLAVSDDAGARWQLVSVGDPFAVSALGPTDDTSPLGPVQGIAATPTGFVAALTVGGALVRAGGPSDVDLVTVAAPTASGPARHGHRHRHRRHPRRHGGRHHHRRP